MIFDPTLAALVSEMPKGLLSLMEREQGASKNVAHGGLPRRAFLKVGVVSGFALGAFPLTTLAQAGAAPGAPVALKPFEQPSAFVRIATDGTVTVTVNRLEFRQGVQQVDRVAGHAEASAEDGVAVSNECRGLLGGDLWD